MHPRITSTSAHCSHHRLSRRRYSAHTVSLEYKTVTGVCVLSWLVNRYVPNNPSGLPPKEEDANFDKYTAMQKIMDDPALLKQVCD